MNAGAAQLADAQHPWIGLASFTESDREFFAGRGEEIDELLRLVRRDTLTLLYGVSGLGKTSLLQAGLVPALRAEDCLPVPIRLDYLEGAEALATQVRSGIIAAARGAGVEAPQPCADETLWEYFHREGNDFWSPRNDLVTPLVALDQFEELFTLGRETPERARRAATFISELAGLVENRPPETLREDPQHAREFNFKPAPLKVLLSMREDYLPDLDRVRFHFRALGQNRLRLLPMGKPQARQVIDLGAPLMAPGVEERIVKFVAGGSADGDDGEITVAPALLSLVLQQLNERRLDQGPDAKITPDLLDRQQKKIFEEFYLRALQHLAPGVRTFIEDRLLTASGYRNSCALDDALSCPGVTQPILDELVNYRLLAYEDRHRARRVEITHDVLAPVIKTSRDTRLAREALAQAERQKREADERARVARKRFAVVAVLLVLAVIAGASFGLWKAQIAREQGEEIRRNAVKADFGIALAYLEKASAADPRALAHLARAVRTLPEDPLPRQYLISLFRDRPWCLALTEPMRHDAEVVAASFSSNGQRVVTASFDKTARLWNASTGEPFGQPMQHEDKVVSARFSPDGQRVVAASDDSTARLWNSTGEQVGAPMKHNGKVNSAEFSPDGQRVLTASDDRSARLWNAETAQPLSEPMAKNIGPLSTAQFSPDGQRVITACYSSMGGFDALLWNGVTGERLDTKPLWHPGGIRSAQFSPDGQRVITAFDGGMSDDGAARLWELAAGKSSDEPITIRFEGSGAINYAEFGPDGQRAVTAADDKTARLWNATTGLPLTTEPDKALSELMNHEKRVGSAHFSPDGRWVVTASDDATARVWDAATGRPESEPLRHGSSVRAASFSADSARIVTASDDKTARIWEVQTGQSVAMRLGDDVTVRTVGFSADGALIVTAEKGGTVRIWDAKSGRQIGTIPHAMATSASFSADGKLIVAVCVDGALRTWDEKNGALVRETLRHSFGTDEGDVRAAVFSADGARLVTVSEDKTARIWDAKTGQPMGAPLRHEEAVHAANFSADGSHIVTASDDKTARIWDAKTGQPVSDPLRHEGAVLAASFSADGSRIVTASRDWTARIWDAKTGQPMGAPLRHEGAVLAANFSADGRRIVTASDDKTARIWDAKTGQPVSDPLRHEGAVLAASFSADGSRIVTVLEDGIALIWDVAVDRETRLPPWVPELAEALGGERFNEEGLLVAPKKSMVELRTELLALEGDDFWSRLGRWFFTRGPDRTISPTSDITFGAE